MLGTSLLFVLSFALAFFSNTASASREDRGGGNKQILENICVPRYSKGYDDNHKLVNGWLTARFINRATIEITYTPNGDCATPDNTSSQYFYQTKKFADILAKQGLLKDNNTSDCNYDYRVGNGDQDSDDTRIDNFKNDGDLCPGRDDGGGRDTTINVNSNDDFLKYLDRAEITLGIEEDVAKISSPSEGGQPCPQNNANFVLHIDGDGPFWECWEESIGDLTGYTIGRDNFKDLANFNITYVVKGTGDSMTIEHVSPREKGTRTFSWNPAANSGRGRFQTQDGNLFIDSTPSEFESITGNSTKEFDVRAKDGGTFKVRVAGSNSESAQADDAADSLAEEQPSCESEGGEMSWLLCPILRLADNVVKYLDNQIETLLKVPNSYFQGSEAENLRATWARLRNIAYIILVPIMLVMVIGTALGFSFIDAYTIKKALPRLVVAVLFMSLSYELTTFMIELTNIVSSGILGLMTSSFGGGDITLSSLFDPGFVEGGIFTGTLLVGVVAGAGFAALAGIGVLLSYGFVVVLALLMGFLLLAMRQFLLIALILLAPLAILGWIFPGNDRLWKLWWGTFSKLLLLFPLIMILIGGGRVFAKVADQAQGQGLLQTILILTAYVAPYFFIPATFKFAGGLFATVTGAMNDRTRGIFDRQRKKRGEALKARRERASSENLFNPASRFRRTAAFGNKLTTWTAYPGANAKYAVGKFGQRKGIGLLSGMGSGIRSSINQKMLDQTGKLSQEMQAAGFNDKALATVAGIHSGLSKQVRQGLAAKGLLNKRLTSRSDIVTAAEILQTATDKNGEFSETERIGANAMLGFADRIGGLYSDTEMNYANVAGAAVMEWSRQGFASTSDLAEFGNTEVKSSNKETAQELVTRAQLMGQQARTDLKAGYGVLFDPGDEKTGRPAKFLSGVVKKGEPPITRADPKAYRRWRATDRGKALVKTVKQTDWLGAKSMAVQELYSNIKAVASETDADGNLTTEARSMREQIELGASQFSSSDVGAKVVWKELADDFGLDVAAFDRAQAELRARNSAAGGPAASGGGEGGGNGGGAGGAAGGGGAGGGAA